MADNSEQILKFLYQLAEKSRKTAKKDIKELTTLANQLGINKLEAWDIPYWDFISWNKFNLVEVFD